MKQLFALCLVVATAVSLVACGSKNAPSGPSRTVVDLRVTGPNTLLISQSANYTATATYSDGGSSAESATWTSSSADVAEISPVGSSRH